MSRYASPTETPETGWSTSEKPPVGELNASPLPVLDLHATATYPVADSVTGPTVRVPDPGASAVTAVPAVGADPRPNSSMSSIAYRTDPERPNESGDPAVTELAFGSHQIWAGGGRSQSCCRQRA